MGVPVWEYRNVWEADADGRRRMSRCRRQGACISGSAGIVDVGHCFLLHLVERRRGVDDRGERRVQLGVG